MEQNENEQVVNESESTVAETNSAEQSKQTDQSTVTQEQSGSESKYVPYERFQEMVHARQESDTKIKAYEDRMARMERDFQSRFESIKQPEAAKPAHPLISAMREIDPKYAEYFEQQESRLKDYDSLKAELHSFKQDNLRKQYESTIDKLHQDNKTPDVMKAFIRSDLDAKAIRGEIQTVDQVERFYKANLDTLNKFLESRARETTKGYVQDKRKDASTPSSQPKGVAASGKNQGFKGTREEMLADLAKRAVARARAERDV